MRADGDDDEDERCLSRKSTVSFSSGSVSIYAACILHRSGVEKRSKRNGGLRCGRANEPLGFVPRDCRRRDRDVHQEIEYYYCYYYARLDCFLSSIYSTFFFLPPVGKNTQLAAAALLYGI